MKLRQHKPNDLTTQRRLQFGQLGILLDGINSACKAVYGKHALPLADRRVTDTINLLPWPVKAHNRSPKRLAAFKHSVTVLTLQSA